MSEKISKNSRLNRVLSHAFIPLPDGIHTISSRHIMRIMQALTVRDMVVYLLRKNSHEEYLKKRLLNAPRNIPTWLMPEDWCYEYICTVFGNEIIRRYEGNEL